MRCPKCSSKNSKVLETRAGKASAIRRRRKCLDCGHRFSTMEEILREGLVVIKRDGRRESFERSKTSKSLLSAISKRQIEVEQVDALLSDVLRRIENEYDNEVPSRAIADVIMSLLRNVDEIAWLRFASFYQDFRGLSRFAREIVNLNGDGE